MRPRSVATVMPTTAASSSSQTGAPLHPGEMWCAVPSASMEIQPCPTAPSSRPPIQAPCSAVAGKARIRKRWSQTSPAPASGTGVVRLSGVSSGRRSSAMSPVPSAATGCQADTEAS
ncbi:hypothetical protein SPURM210S_02499 [Streptomyces purpurascens]|nr:hypothetical protein GCM10010303_81010 [Streptomyces purpurascens]